MAFLLADSFQSSLEKLSGEEQKAAKLAAFELQINAANPGLQCHRLDNIKDKNFWSARASQDIRLIFHRAESSVMLCYLGHHDPAYDWARRRKIETNPVTGGAQIVVILETVREIQTHLPVFLSPCESVSGVRLGFRRHLLGPAVVGHDPQHIPCVGKGAIFCRDSSETRQGSPGDVSLPQLRLNCLCCRF
jgi:mRNA-degrading endonuclease RelE of RelBE toxin-antitoxin system